MRYLTASLIVASFSLLSSCAKYAGTKSEDRSFTLAYHRKPVKLRSEADNRSNKILDWATGELIGLAFDWAGDQLEDLRTGDYSEKGVVVQGISKFPDTGTLLLVRTVKDPKNEYPNVASIGDLQKLEPGTPGTRLLQKIEGTTSLKREALATTIIKQLQSTGKAKGSDKIALLLVCPVNTLSGSPPNSRPLYGISFGGMYYPLLGASRIAFIERFLETNKLSRRFVDAKESVNIEIFGPNGSGYTTGVIKLPVAWTPPENDDTDAEWVTPDKLSRGLGLSKDEIKKLEKSLSNKVGQRLARRSAFVRSPSDINQYLRANISLSENSDVSGWLKSGLDSLEDTADDAVGD